MIDHISGTVIYNVNITANKITFEKSENLEKKNHRSQTWLKFNKKFFFFFFNFTWFFLNCPGGTSI